MAVDKALTLPELLVVENDPSVLNFCCTATGLPLWPQIRVAFIRMIMSDLLYKVPLARQQSRPASAARAMSTMSRSIIRNWRFRLSGQCRAEVCLFSVGVGNQLIDRKWFNRLTDYFALCTPTSALTIEEHFEWNWHFPRHNERLMLHAPQQAFNAIVGKFCVRETHRRQARALVDVVAGRARRHLDWTLGTQRERWLVSMLARKSASLPTQYRAYTAMLNRIRPKLLIVGSACYGPAAAVIAAARDLGIVTAEFQHGAVSAGHDAYNFAAAVRNSADYRRTLPEHFLSYGTWWEGQIDVPLRKTAIGNPHREALLERAPIAEVTKRTVLILSDGIEFDLYLDLALQVESAVRAKGLNVVLRPHPLERSRVEAKYRYGTDRVVLDRNVDLYTSLRSAHTVISEVSTGLFEAVGLVDRVFIWDTRKARFGYPSHPFQRFSFPAELSQMLAAENVGNVPKDLANAIWAPDWRRNYLRFLSEVGIS